MTYSDLVALVANYMNRSDLEAEIPEFITSCESDANTFLAGNPVRPMTTPYTISTADQAFALPPDFIDVIKLTASDGTNSWTLARIGVETDQNYVANKELPPGYSYDTSIPQQFRIIGSALTLAVAPVSELDLSLLYTAKLAAVSETTTSNWLMDGHPNVYKFGTLAHAAHRIRDYDYRDENKSLFQNELGAVLLAYPEKRGPIGLRMFDSPFGSNCRNVFHA